MDVTHTGDAGPGSLRHALETVNAAAADHAIIRILASPIRLTSPLPPLRVSADLVGPPEERAILDGDGRWPLIEFAAGTTGEVARLVLTNALATGYRHGAALATAGTVTVRDCLFAGNRNRFGWGGAIYNRGHLTLRDCEIRDNEVAGEPGGDASIDLASAPTRGHGPGGGGAGLGGGVFHELGSLTAIRTVFTGNACIGGAGGRFDWDLGGTGRGGGPFGGAPSLTGLPAGNGGYGSGAGGLHAQNGTTGGYGGFGGGSTIELAGDLGETGFGGTWAYMSFQGGGGAGAAFGGALFARAGVVSLSECSFASNRVTGGQGAVGILGASSGGAGMGGAIFSHAAVVTLERCRLDENLAGGGAGAAPSDGTLGEFTGAGGAAKGGAAFGYSGSLGIEITSLSSNRVVGGTGGSGKNGGTGGPSQGGALAYHRAEVHTTRSLFRGNAALGGPPGGGRRAQGHGGRAEGGAIGGIDGSLAMEASTLSGNRAAGATAYSGSFGFSPAEPGASLGAAVSLSSQRVGERAPGVIFRDLGDGTALATRLRDSSDPVTTLVRNQLEAPLRAQLSSWSAPSPLPPTLLQGLFNALNAVIYGSGIGDTPALWNPTRFAGVTLRPETEALLAAPPSASEVAKLNRLLLEDAYPGAIEHLPPVRSTLPTALLRFATVTDNEAVQAELLSLFMPPLAVGVVGGGGLHNAGGRITLEGAICAGNRAATNADVDGPFASLRINLVGTPGSATGFTDRDLLGQDPRLEPLAEGGGPTLTHGLSADSPAIDRIRDLPDPGIDQRGEARPRGFGWDLGAFESAHTATPSSRLLIRRGTHPASLLILPNDPSDAAAELEHSTDLRSWKSLGPLENAGTLDIESGASQGFYRLRR